MTLSNKLLLCAFCFVILMQAFAKDSKEKEKSVSATEHKDYKVLYSNDLRTLESDVHWNIGVGWQPIGGIEVEGQTYYQALGR